MSQSNSKTNLKDIPFSILDLAPVVEGGTIPQALRNTLDLAQNAEKWGYNRIWVAEHHNMSGIASSATSVLIGYIAAGTSTIRVGSGGIMLPNHAPLVIAEQFGTLESLYPGRIDLGLGRAPGTDQATVQALRRDVGAGHRFPEDVEELRSFFKPTPDSMFYNRVHAYPGEGLDIPIWLLGSSGFSAELAGRLGLPFAFASHFSPANTLGALQTYRNYFEPSDVLKEPYAMIGVNVIAAETNEKASFLATSMEQRFLQIVRNKRGKLPPPVKQIDWSEIERQAVEEKARASIIGDRETVHKKLQAFVDQTGANEIIATSNIYDHNDRLKSYELLMSVKEMD